MFMQWLKLKRGADIMFISLLKLKVGGEGGLTLCLYQG